MMSNYSDNGGMMRSNAVCGVSAVAILFLFVLTSCSRQPSLSPPDLSSCTRLEIRWPQGVVRYFFHGLPLRNILSPRELEYIQSLDPHKMDDLVRIRAFARIISQGTYVGRRSGETKYANPVQLTCYRAGKFVTSFTIYGDTIVLKDGRKFRYSDRSLGEGVIGEPAQIGPFRSRFQCAWNIEMLWVSGPLSYRKAATYPAPDRWCDVVLKTVKREEYFACPSAHTVEEQSDVRTQEPNAPSHYKLKYESYYALNPNCQPGSPCDTVLLFETAVGWNQHGGPDLFTFDNHNPRGGLVLLNDGTVQFIRTEEELKQLRWK
jgi:hypothetical protein